jgi:hypothetical protein
VFGEETSNLQSPTPKIAMRIRLVGVWKLGFGSWEPA